MFDDKDYQRGAAALGAEPKNLMAVAAIESSGENFWQLDGKAVPPIRPEAHWFSHYTNHKYDSSHPDISSYSWNPGIAATSRQEAWDQYEEMKSLDPEAAIKSTSWGPFQIMGFHYQDLGFTKVEDFVDAMDGPDDDGQMDTFTAFVKGNPTLLRAIRRGDWETWETGYNGGGYGGAYAAKIRNWLAAHDGGVPRELRIGDEGEDVKKLQTALGIVSDGDFGPATEQAVIAFQQNHSLVADGVVGRFTKEALNIA